MLAADKRIISAREQHIRCTALPAAFGADSPGSNKVTLVIGTGSLAGKDLRFTRLPGERKREKARGAPPL